MLPYIAYMDPMGYVIHSRFKRHQNLLYVAHLCKFTWPLSSMMLPSPSETRTAPVIVDVPYRLLVKSYPLAI